MSRHNQTPKSAERSGFIDAAFENALTNNDPLLPPGAKAAKGSARTKLKQAWWTLVTSHKPELEEIASHGSEYDTKRAEELDHEWGCSAEIAEYRPSKANWKRFHRINIEAVAFENLHEASGITSFAPDGYAKFLRENGLQAPAENQDEARVFQHDTTWIAPEV